MALVVEDGTGLANAESYISVADADTYFSDRGNATWAALTTLAKEQALRKATDYLVATYELRWMGARTTSTQALDWPRMNVPRPDIQGGYRSFPLYWDYNVVPTAITRACAELALRASSADLVADVGAQVKQETVGPISVTYTDGARQQTHYEQIERMLAPYLKGMGSVPVARA